METLETTPPKDFFNDIGKKIFYQVNHDNSVGYHENLYQENKEITEQLIKAKD